MRIRKLRVSAALSVVSCLAGWAALAPPDEPPVPAREVADPRECATTATLRTAIELFDATGSSADNAAAIAAMRQASRCEDIGAVEAMSALDVWRIAKLAIADARLRGGEEALAQILDVWSVGLDLGQAGGLIEVHVSAAITNTASDAILDLLASADLDAGAIVAARARIAGFQARPTDFEAATARDTRAFWHHLAEEPRAIVSYARWKASRRFELLEAAMRDRRDADARTDVVAAALDRRWPARSRDPAG